MRDLKLHVPIGTVSNTKAESEYALRQMQSILKADITSSDALDLSGLALGGSGQNLASPKRGSQNLSNMQTHQERLRS